MGSCRPIRCRRTGNQGDHRFAVAHVEDFMRHARLDINEIGGLVFHYLLEGGMSSGLTTIKEQRRLASPAITPQALTWDDKYLWMGSRNLRRIYKIDIDRWKIVTKNRTMSGGSRGLIRGRRNLKSKISRLFRSRAGHSNSRASCSGRIIALRTTFSLSRFLDICTQARLKLVASTATK